MKAAAIAGIIVAVVSILVIGLHSIPDLIITLAQDQKNIVLLPAALAFPYRVAGAVGDPIVIVSTFVIGLGFVAIGRQSGNQAAKVAGVVAFAYCAVRTFWAVATLRYAMTAGNVAATGDLSNLAFLGMLKGLAALVVGITGGVVLASFLLSYFSRTETKVGKIGALLVLASVPIGIAAKASSLWVWAYGMMALFLVLMLVKSVGIALMSVGLWQQAENLTRILEVGDRDEQEVSHVALYLQGSLSPGQIEYIQFTFPIRRRG